MTERLVKLVPDLAQVSSDGANLAIQYAPHLLARRHGFR